MSQISAPDSDKQTWNQNTGQIDDSGDNDVRDKGNLDPGYWCDQAEDDGTFTVDSADWLTQRGKYAAFSRSDRNKNGNANMMSSSEGENLGDRIIGGQNAQAHAWAYIAYFYGCGATLVAKNWAVTAAHCCTIPAWYFKDKDLCFGRDFKTAANNDNVSLEQCAGIASIIQHPNYDRTTTVMNDICLLKVINKQQFFDITGLRFFKKYFNEIYIILITLCFSLNLMLSTMLMFNQLACQNKVNHLVTIWSSLVK